MLTELVGHGKLWYKMHELNMGEVVKNSRTLDLHNYG